MTAKPQADTALDVALDTLHGGGPTWAGGLANHGPMAAEALVTLGAEEAAVHWAGRYVRRLPPLADSHPVFLEALAKVEGKIDESGWEAVLRHRLPRLLGDVIAGSAGHGLLRVAHAVRALEWADTPARRAELAHGLAYWGVSFRALDTPPAVLTGELDPVSALRSLPATASIRPGFITDVVQSVAADSTIAAVVASLRPPVDVPVDVTAALSSVTEAAAWAYVAGAPAGGVAPIALVHAVTVPSALRILLPYVSDAELSAIFAGAWQAVVLLVAGYGAGVGAAGTAGATRNVEWADLTAAAIEAADEHAIKLTGSAASEDALRPSPAYAAAAADVVDRLRDPELAP